MAPAFQRLFKNPRIARWLFNVYPPFLFTATQITHISPDWRRVDVRMPILLTRNFVGTQFGGALYAMTDPWYVIMLIQQLGSGYIVWDKAATIQFRRPGRGTVYASFAITEEQLTEIRTTVDTKRKMDVHFVVPVLDKDGELIAEVEKVLYVRRKHPKYSALPLP